MKLLVIGKTPAKDQPWPVECYNYLGGRMSQHKHFNIIQAQTQGANISEYYSEGVWSAGLEGQKMKKC